MKRNSVTAIIQARLTSTRLPGKVLLKLENKTVLEHVISRVNLSKLCSDVIVATTINKTELPIVKLCSKLGIRTYCGSENDVLDRYYQIARLIKSKHIVRITSDCPMIDHNVIDLVIKKHINSNSDYTSNTIIPTYPDGLDCEVFRFNAIEKAWKNATVNSDREHVTPYIYRHPKIFSLKNIKNKSNISNKRWTLDSPEDYEFMKVVFKNLYKKNKYFGINEIIKFLKNHPGVEKINKNYSRNEGYQKSLREN